MAKLQRLFVFFSTLLVPNVASADLLADIDSRLCGVPEQIQQQPYAPDAQAFGRGPFVANLKVVTGNVDSTHEVVAHCGATAISRDWLLTAAHCVGDEPWQRIDVHLGSNDRSNGSGVRRQVEAAICPADHVSGKLSNDIAMLKLSKPLPEGFPVAPLAGADDTQRVINSGLAIASSWSRINYNEISNIKRHVLMRVHEIDFLQRLVTTGYQGGSGVCEGESGAPLVTRIDGKLVQVAVLSALDGHVDETTGQTLGLCQVEGGQSYFTPVAPWQHWIENVMQLCITPELCGF